MVFSPSSSNNTDKGEMRNGASSDGTTLTNSKYSSTSTGSTDSAGSMAPAEVAKRFAAYACADAQIRSGMRLGIGSGSTVKYLIDWLEEKVQSGQLHDIQCVPTSYQTRHWLQQAKLPTHSLESLNQLDLTIDGADEADGQLNCIKGGGGCLLQERLVQACAQRFILIGDRAKLCQQLGTNFKRVPIEITPYGCEPVKRWITEKYGGECVLRMDHRKCFPVNTENHNYILDWYFPAAPVEKNDWAEISRGLIAMPGVVETGLFVGVASAGYFSTPEGKVDVVKTSVVKS